MTYQETLTWLYSQLPMYQRQGAVAFKKDLGNIRALSKALDNPQDTYHTIHIAGTNGKGSVAHALAAVLTASGYKTGLYTSPHYVDFRERIRIDGEMITKEQVIDFVANHARLFEKIKPSFFEMSVAMAFHYFKEQAVDIAVIETGLGGRLDSTNILKPFFTIITNVSFDHMDMLGDSLSKIAQEKAGIIKQGVPLVVGDDQAELLEVVRSTCEEKNSPWRYAGHVLESQRLHQTTSHTIYDVYRNGSKYYDQLEVNWLGQFQVANLNTVLASLLEIEKMPQGEKINEQTIRKGLLNLRKISGMMGRWQVLNLRPLIIADGAHNEAGVREAVEQLENYNAPRIHIVWGVVKDKDLETIGGFLPRNATYYWTQAKIPRAMPVEELEQRMMKLGRKGHAYQDVYEAYSAANALANLDDVIWIGGSIFTVGELLQKLKEDQNA